MVNVCSGMKYTEDNVKINEFNFNLTNIYIGNINLTLN